MMVHLCSLVFAAFSVVGIGTVIGLVLFVRRKLGIARDQSPSSTATVGGRIGWVRYQGPFVNLRLYEDFLIINCITLIALRYTEIERVEVKYWLGLIPRGIRIIHHSPDVPSTIVIGTYNYDVEWVKAFIDARLQQ